MFYWEEALSDQEQSILRVDGNLSVDSEHACPLIPRLPFANC